MSGEAKRMFLQINKIIWFVKFADILYSKQELDQQTIYSNIFIQKHVKSTAV